MANSFITYLDSIKNAKNVSLIESIKAGYKAIVEARAMSLDELDGENFDDDSYEDVKEGEGEAVQWGTSNIQVDGGKSVSENDCPFCHGTGYGQNWRKCTHCHGTGVASNDGIDAELYDNGSDKVAVLPTNFSSECPKCNGTGKLKSGKLCGTCNGVGYIVDRSTVELTDYEHLCNTCDGTGLVYNDDDETVDQCADCNGSGIIRNNITTVKTDDQPSSELPSIEDQAKTNKFSFMDDDDDE